MGIILDSSIVIHAERLGETPSELLSRLAIELNDQPIALSAIGYTELAYTQYSGTNKQRQLSRNYLDDLTSRLHVHAYTVSTAAIAARLNARQTSIGLTVPFADLLIASSALELNYSILTLNLRHFRSIPGLDVLTL